MDYLIEHVADIALIITSIIALASAIAAITPTKKDDEIIKKIKKVIDVLALNVGNAKK